MNNYIIPIPMPNKNAHFTIYYRQGCAFSMGALSLLQTYRGKHGKQLLYSAYDVNPIIANIIKEKNIRSTEKGKEIFFNNFEPLIKGHRTYPLIFVNENGKIKYLGGFTELQNYLA